MRRPLSAWRPCLSAEPSAQGVVRVVVLLPRSSACVVLAETCLCELLHFEPFFPASYLSQLSFAFAPWPSAAGTVGFSALEPVAF